MVDSVPISQRLLLFSLSLQPLIPLQLPLIRKDLLHLKMQATRPCHENIVSIQILGAVLRLYEHKLCILRLSLEMGG